VVRYRGWPVDSAALALSGFAKIAPWAPLPPEVSGLISSLELHPRTREQAASRLHGQEQAATVLSMSSTVAQALGARSAGVLLDIAGSVTTCHAWSVPR
jgi:cation-transporting P-type ATPase I